MSEPNEYTTAHLKAALHTLEYKVVRMESDIHEVRQVISELSETLNGGHESPGLRMQVDRLLQSQLSERDRRAVYLGPLMTGFVTAIAGAVASGVVVWLTK